MLNTVWATLGPVATAATLVPMVSQAGQAVFSECVTKYVHPPGEAVDQKRDDFGSVLEELDVYAALETGKALIATIQKKDDMDEDWVVENPRDVTQVCIANLVSAMDLLQADLSVIEKVTAAHNSKWFAQWRTLDIQAHVGALKKHKRLFDMRFKMLLDVVAAMRH